MTSQCWAGGRNLVSIMREAWPCVVPGASSLTTAVSFSPFPIALVLLPRTDLGPE